MIYPSIHGDKKTSEIQYKNQVKSNLKFEKRSFHYKLILEQNDLQ